MILKNGKKEKNRKLFTFLSPFPRVLCMHKTCSLLMDLHHHEKARREKEVSGVRCFSCTYSTDPRVQTLMVINQLNSFISGFLFFPLFGSLSPFFSCDDTVLLSYCLPFIKIEPSGNVQEIFFAGLISPFHSTSSFLPSREDLWPVHLILFAFNGENRSAKFDQSVRIEDKRETLSKQKQKV